MFFVKLLKVKKYLNENLSKRFITSSQTLYFFFVLFILKANKDLWFCMNYQKLNGIFKRNKYSLSLINEIIDKIVNCKHLTRLITSSQVLEFKSSTQLKKFQVKLKDFWIQVTSSWKVELKNSNRVEKLDSTTQLENLICFNKILDKCK